MSQNEILALDARLKLAHEERAPDSPEDEFFEIFASEQILKDFDLTDEEIEAGQVGGENDGGVDGIYFLVNRQLVTDDFDINPKTVTRADIFFIQATREQSFNEKRVAKLNLLTEDFLDFSRGPGQLHGTYNSDVVSVMMTFKEQYQKLLAYPHDLTISYCYMSKGDIKTINVGLRRQSERVQEKATQLFPKAIVSFRFIGAAVLLDLINKQPQKAYPLEYTEMISPAGQQAWVCLVPMVAYNKFITNDEGEMKNELFEGNVRDWQGDNDVNEAIRGTLESGVDDEDFWWLNNGITVLASGASSQGGHVLSVQMPQIVNGLQTSRCIYNYLNAKKGINEHRNVLVRIIATQRVESPDHIIKATNSQTQVPPFRLHMTEPIHRNIESLLRNHNLFYDRRKNFYKNEGRPITRIIQPLALAQTIMSVVLHRPNDARGRPNSVLEKSYAEIFSTQYSLQLFAVCALLMRKVNAFLLLPDLRTTRTERTDLRWYLAMQYSRTLTGTDAPTVDELTKMVMPADDKLLHISYKRVSEIYKLLGATDLVAKGTTLVEQVKKLAYS
ncbi:MAG: AIPR family protein [Dehalococcoidia bacterium]